VFLWNPGGPSTGGRRAYGGGADRIKPPTSSALPAARVSNQLHCVLACLRSTHTSHVVARVCMHLPLYHMIPVHIRTTCVYSWLMLTDRSLLQQCTVHSMAAAAHMLPCHVARTGYYRYIYTDCMACGGPGCCLHKDDSDGDCVATPLHAPTGHNRTSDLHRNTRSHGQQATSTPW
jgi:hypothetical protein